MRKVMIGVGGVLLDCFGWAIKKTLVIATALWLLSLCGCVNCVVRHSPQPPYIESVYQCTRMAAAGTMILAFPQMMSDAPGQGLWAENLFTIPLGIIAFCVDVPLEIVVDTVCLPYDAYKTFKKEGVK